MIARIGDYGVDRLTREVAARHAARIARMLDQIPLVRYTEKELLAESKGSRPLLGKWEHSLAAFDDETPIAVVIGYERPSGEGYPDNSIYISELAVVKECQGKGLQKGFFLHSSATTGGCCS